jgi:AbrB family looped-hinge helix DNA binding protein
MSNTVTISPKYQVVIPKAVREKLGLAPGQKVEALALEGRVELVPVRSPRQLRGAARVVDSRVEREGDRV